jgi:hypothetical protein
MGLYLYSIRGKEPRAVTNMIFERGWVWLVVRIERAGSNNERWHIQGAATSESMARGMCISPDDLIGPLPLNTRLPENPLEWAGAYFPLASD